MDDIFVMPIETLEMCNGYEHYEIVSVYRNRATYLMVLTNTLNSVFTCEEVSVNGRDDKGVVIVRPKKRKKTFIKTLKELVDSGWYWDCSFNALKHPSSKSCFDLDMFEHFGQEYEDQYPWEWTPEMLIEKEVRDEQNAAGL